jgi:predicted TIM-barrel fold metal-dependent hydrolase
MALTWNGLEVVDFHVHLPVPWPRGGRRGLAARRAARPPQAEKILADYGLERRRQWRKEWNFPEPEEFAGAKPEVQADRWAGEVDKHGLRAACLVSGGGNDTLAAVVRRHPDRLRGMAHHNLAAPDAGPEMRRAVEELGLVGLKIIAPALDVRFDDPALDAMWGYVERKGAPVLIHFGWLGTGGGTVSHPNINPLTIYEVASRHPGIPFVIAHFGCGYWRETLQLAWSCPNIHVDTSGSNQWIRWVPYTLTLEDLFRRAYETIGPTRIVFGTDSSWFPRGFSQRYLEEQVKVTRYLGMKDEDVALIFGGNACRLLRLEGRPRE